MERRRFIQDFSGNSLTKQNYKKQCSIDDIVARARKIGSLDPLRPRSVPMYMDCSEVPDLTTAMNTVIRANQLLMSLPPGAREKFKNDAEVMIAFLADPKNRKEAVELGLMKPEEKKVEPEKVPGEEVK